MPYQSNKQRAFLKINKPAVAKKFDEHEGHKRHENSSTSAARLGSYAHKAAHAAGKAKRYK